MRTFDQLSLNDMRSKASTGEKIQNTVLVCCLHLLWSLPFFPNRGEAELGPKSLEILNKTIPCPEAAAPEHPPNLVAAGS